jgi:hypothetical protein
MVENDKEKQQDLFGFDLKEKKENEEQQKKIKAEFRKRINKLRKESNIREQRINLERPVKESEEELREWELLGYIKNNYKKIIIPKMEVIEHKESSKGFYKSNKGFIDSLVPFPIFPHKDDNELQLAKEALIWFEDTLDMLLIDPPYFPATFINCLGGIRPKDVHTRFAGMVIEEVGTISEYNESKYFSDVYMFSGDESGYVYKQFYDDMSHEFTDIGLHFKWKYPEYFKVFDNQFDKFAKRLWDELLDVTEVWHA